MPPPALYEGTSQYKGRPNALGYHLIDFCKSNDMIILNGSLGSDKGIGKVTSKECSVVDYVIASSLVLPYFRKFEILDFDPIYSDVHCGVSFSIESKESWFRKVTKESWFRKECKYSRRSYRKAKRYYYS